MKILPLLLLAATAPNVDVSMLDGSARDGRLEALTASTLTLTVGDERTRIDTAELLEVRFDRPEPPQNHFDDLPQVRLTDGSKLACNRVFVEGERVRLEGPGLDEFSVALHALSSVRFAAADQKIDEAWRDILNRQLKQDLLVVRRGEVLDHLDGIIGNFDGQRVSFVHNGDVIPVNREKVFGVVYARRADDGPKPQCEVQLTGDDLIRAAHVTFDGEKLQAQLLSGTAVGVPLARLRSLDFSLGKVRYLSQMDPLEVKYTPGFDVTWEYERDRKRWGGPLQLGGRTFARGLWIHSKTYLRYRIGSEYRRFQAVMGIDEAVARNGLGNVHVVISGDGRTLLEADVRGTDEPREVDLDVSGVRDLEILVDFGSELDIADHLDLADARVIK